MNGVNTCGRGREVVAVLEDEAEEAVACFAGEFTFKDHGIGMEFKDKDRLSKFFRKTRELYPDSFLATDTILASADQVIIEWTFKTTLTEPFYGGLSAKTVLIAYSKPNLTAEEIQSGVSIRDDPLREFSFIFRHELESLRGSL